jgi:L-seryl-tRNA(Ser) seleniumtransferase
MADIAGKFVSISDYHKKAGEYLAQILGVESAMVTSGAAAGLLLGTASCMVGDDPTTAARIPEPPPRHKVIIQCCHRNPFDRAIQMAGATLVQIGDAIRTRPEDLQTALAKDVAAVAFFLQAEMLEASLSLANTIEIAHTHGIPVIVDAAAELPPKQNLWTFAQAGADLVIFSGSKDLRGPQTSGLIVGSQDLINSAMAQAAPHEHVIGRPMKAGKEVIAGVVTAVECYLEEDEDARFAEWEKIAAFLKDRLEEIDGCCTRRFTPTQPYIQPACIPRVGITFEENIGHTAPGIKTDLWEADQPIAAEVIGEELWINVHTLTMAEAEIIVQQIKTILH